MFYKNCRCTFITIQYHLVYIYLCAVHNFLMFLWQARTWSLEGSLKLKNPFGYADIWDLSGSYGWDQATELSAGLSLPRFKALPTSLSARVSLLSQDWLKFSSYKERLLGVPFGLLSMRNHDLAYSLTWHHLTYPSSMASKSIRRHLGYGLLSSIKYIYKLDHRFTDEANKGTCLSLYYSSWCPRTR